MRVLLAFIVVSVLGTWMAGCYFAGALVAIPDNAVMLITTFGGVKAIQRFGEKSDNDPTPPPAPTGA